jgi:signal recognition particle receptor subunit alpha
VRLIPKAAPKILDTDIHPHLSAEVLSPTKRKSKAKQQRKWGDSAITAEDMASLDYSMDAPPTDGMSVLSPSISSLVDSASLGTRTNDGMYEVKDWEFVRSAGAVSSEEDDLIARALRGANTNGAGGSSSKADSSSSGGVFGSLFARITGTKALTEEDLKPVLEAMKQRLMQKNVAREIAEKVCEGVGESLVGQKIGGFQSKLLSDFNKAIVYS